MEKFMTITITIILILLYTTIKTVNGINLTPTGLYINTKCQYYDNWAILESDKIQIDCSD